MQKIKDAFSNVEKVLAKAQSEIIAELEAERTEISKASKSLAKTKKSVAEATKKLEEGQLQLEKDKVNMAAGLKLIRKDEELSEVVKEVDADRAYVETWRKELTERENIVKGKLEEVEKRELKLLDKQRAYKKELEEKIIKKFMTE